MPPFNRLQPYRFIFPAGEPVDEMTITGLFLELALQDVERHGTMQVRPYCPGLVLTTLN